jgi:hypothetical protein
LGWSAFIAGKRESRRLLGDIILKADDFRNGTDWPDAAFPNTWHIDIHVPHPDFKDGLQGEEFISVATTGKEYSYQGPYWAPYRCLVQSQHAETCLWQDAISASNGKRLAPFV